jgi:hypothetical protein
VTLTFRSKERMVLLEGMAVKRHSAGWWL